MKYKFYLLLYLFFMIRIDAIELKFINFTTQKGLSYNQVHSICQDAPGFIWIGTEKGLNRYDGNTFELFWPDSDDSTSVASSIIRQIFEDSDTNLWIMHLSGVDRYNRDEHIFDHYHFPVEDSVGELYHCVSIVEDNKKQIWVATKNKIYYLNQQNHRMEAVFDHFKTGLTITKMFTAKNGLLWLGTEKHGLIQVDCMNKQTKTYNHQELEDVNAIMEDHDSTLWIASPKGIFVLRPGSAQIVRLQTNQTIAEQIDQIAITSLFLDEKDSNIWIGSRANGLFYYDRKKQEVFNFKSNPYQQFALSRNYISCFMRDNQGSYWIGTWFGGVNYVPFTFINGFNILQHNPQDSNSISLNNVSSVYEAKNGWLWIGTDGGGLDCYNPKTGKFKHYEYEPGNPNSIQSNAILAIDEGQDNTILIGTFMGGLSVLDYKTGNIRNYQNDPGRPDTRLLDYVRDIYTTKQNDIWVITSGQGCYLFDPDIHIKKHLRLEQEESEYALCSNYCINMFKDSKNRFWIGSYRGVSLYYRNSETIRCFFHEDSDTSSLSHNWVYSILEDLSGKIWVGTANGLNLFNEERQTFTIYTKKDGLPNNFINGMVLDDHGFIWISTNKGISKFNPENRKFKNYSVSNGLPSNQYPKCSYNKGKNGEIYFGSFNGLVCFHPDSIKQNDYVPPVYITNVMINNQKIDSENTIQISKDKGQISEIFLSYKQNNLVFNYIALNFISSDKNQYAFRLENFDKNWNYVGNQKNAIYTNLDPGHYIFQVRASNNENIWNQEGVELNIHILPPFWQTLWFKSIVLVSLILLILLAIQLRVQSIHKRSQLLEEKIQEANKNLIPLKMAMEQTFDGICLLDMDYRIKFLNPSWAELHGYTAQELIGKKLNIFYGNDYYTSKVYLFLRKVIDSNSNSGELIHIRKDQTEIPVWMTMKLVMNEIGESVEIIAILRDITKQKKAEKLLKDIQKKEIENAQKLGMANLATSTLHNVGNILNNLITSGTVIKRLLNKTNINSYKKANEMLREHIDHLEDFVVNHPKGKKLLEFYLKVEEMIKKENEQLLHQVNRLTENAEAIGDIITAQQIYVKDSHLVSEKLDIRQIIEDALTINRGSLIRYSIKVEKDYEAVPYVSIQKIKMLQILMNLITNAKEAMFNTPKDQRCLKFVLRKEEKTVVLKIIDTGIGIKKENLKKIFNYGFTTKPTGHGFGLHSCANFMTEMKGRISVDSQGENQGVEFTLLIPTE